MAKKPTKSTALAKSAGGVVVSADAETFEGMETGLEHLTAADLIIPRTTILQKMSPQVDKREPEYIEGAEVGDFCDLAIGELFKGELHLLPCYYVMIYLEWSPRESGGGLVANHGTDSRCLNNTERDERNRNMTPEGNYIAETMTFYCLNLSAKGRPCFVPLSSTQLKHGRRWLTLINNEKLTRKDGSEFTPPIFYRSWRATTLDEENAKGNWVGWKFEPGPTVLELDPSNDLLEKAKAFYQQARDGIVRGEVTDVEEGASVRPADDSEAM